MLPAWVAQTETSMLETVIQYGTGRAAAIGQFAAGKTGTTSNYGDAWFVGWDSKYTVAVWVGFPNKLIPMTTDFNGTPGAGRHLPGADLARLHDLGAADRKRTRRTQRRIQGRVRAAARKRAHRHDGSRRHAVGHLHAHARLGEGQRGSRHADWRR